ncbi:hypothetical protein M427DRAFT_156173 [Gonapodya prolifera JEL478]|uniref:FAR-17a/AIG1-like protein n=1 Tax=Gonapodya prolifera (strain JEL478) TaxID=1344416 RepID=A0A139ABP9_GONPJ|nr:hypothetical protein M427DRAFT_156173 [Gonapodya prolifera JEL478]|eukprot:KXS14177.1 hypothetical protein M427DRAFT_156173 [Gonapodya prolifera JEL478]
MDPPMNPPRASSPLRSSSPHRDDDLPKRPALSRSNSKRERLSKYLSTGGRHSFVTKVTEIGGVGGHLISKHALVLGQPTVKPSLSSVFADATRIPGEVWKGLRGLDAWWTAETAARAAFYWCGMSVFIHGWGELDHSTSVQLDDVYDIQAYARFILGSKFKYLTIIAYAMFFGVQVIGLWETIINRHHNQTKAALLALSLPVETIVSLLYWSMYFYDVNLVVAADAEKADIFTDLCYHLFPALWLWADLLTYSDKQERRVASDTFMLFGATYYVWLNMGFHFNRSWPYPFLDMLTFWQRTLFFVAVIGVGVSFNAVATVVHNRMHCAAAAADVRGRKAVVQVETGRAA